MMPFDLLHPYLQEMIRRMEWESFKPIQDESILYVSKNKNDLLIVAPTASGKTEAAFLPSISQILFEPKSSVRILYISPLKALINDQFSRVAELCRLSDINITKWHGDADSSKKQKLIKKPEGIILITPESLEALLINKSEYLSSMFQNLEYIVIDEIHYFVTNERGVQLNSLLNRLQYILNKYVQKIALSATLDDNGIQDVKKWLLNCSNKHASEIIDKQDKGTQGIIKSYIQYTDSQKTPIETSLKQDLLTALSNKKSLIFANKKGTLEQYCDEIRYLCDEQKNNLIVNIHHGSLSKEIRENTEFQLKNSNNIVVFCTNTLELGIDISNIDQIIFLNPPFSVSSLTQRLGRSGRSQDSKKSFRFYLERLNNNDIRNRLDIDLIQSVALIELMLEKWYEPLPMIEYDYSTYIHQLLSYLSMTGGVSALKLYDYLLNKCKIKLYGLTEKNFITLLRNLKDREVIYQDEANNITLGKYGERITEHYTFYATFNTDIEWRLIYSGREIATIPSLPSTSQIGQNILIAGRRWEIVDINEDKKIVLIKPALFKKALLFISGKIKIHRKIHQKMLEIYQNKYIPIYIDKQAEEQVSQSFEQYSDIVQKESNILFVCEGTVIQNTIYLLLKHLSIDFEPWDLGFILHSSKDKIIHALKNIEWISSLEKELCTLLKRSEKESRKFDYLLPDEILDLSYTKEWIDLKGAKNFIDNISIN